MTASNSRAQCRIFGRRNQKIICCVIIFLIAFGSILSNWYNIKGLKYNDDEIYLFNSSNPTNNGTSSTTTNSSGDVTTATNFDSHDAIVATYNNRNTTTTTTTAHSSNLRQMSLQRTNTTIFINDVTTQSSSSNTYANNNESTSTSRNITSRDQRQEYTLQTTQRLRLSEEELGGTNHSYLTIPSRDPQWEVILQSWKDKSRQTRLNTIKEIAQREPLANWKNRIGNKKTQNLVSKDQKAYIKPGVWIHVGKAGGTTLRSVVESPPGSSRYIHSYMAQLCRRCHIGGCSDVELSKFEFFVWLIRDPFERTGSAFEYMHPKNKLSPAMFMPKYKRYTGFTDCFDTFEKFTYYLDHTTFRNSINFTTNAAASDSSSILKQRKCWTKAQGLLQHQHPSNKVGSGGHLYWDTGFWVNRMMDAFPIFKQQQQQQQQKETTTSTHENEDKNNSLNNKTVSKNNNTRVPYMFVIRNEHLWDDYKMINWLLGQNWTTIKTYEHLEKKKDFSYQNQTVIITRKDLSSIGKQRLCNALDREYQDYFWVIRHAINLGPNDLNAALQIAHKNCPNIAIHH